MLNDWSDREDDGPSVWRELAWLAALPVAILFLIVLLGS